MSSLSLAMITNSSKGLVRCLTSIAPFVDEIVIIDNGNDRQVKKIANNFKANWYQVNPTDNPEYFCEFNKEFWPNFTMLRRLSFEKCTKDWILWLDTDDIFINPDLIKDKLIQADRGGVNLFTLQYKYEMADDGAILKVHNKERIVKRGMWNWEKDPEWAVHENLYAIDEKKVNGVMSFDIFVEHHKDKADNGRSNFRNYNILMWMLQKDKFKKDPRVWYLLGRELISLQRYDKALECFNRYLSMEYAAHDALDACIRCSEINEAIGDYKTALNYIMQGIGIRPDHPIGYLYAARYLNLQGKANEALEFLKQAEKRQLNPLDTITQEPLTMVWLAVTGHTAAYSRLKQYDKIIKIIEDNKSRFSGTWLKELEGQKDEAEKKLALDRMLNAITLLINNKTAGLKKKPEINDYNDIFNIFDEGIKLSPLYMNLRRQTGDFRIHEDNEITIVHMNNFEDWDPETLYNNGGGGSETACIELSTCWAKRGYKVTVYAAPPKDNTEFNGVTWRRFEMINLADDFNIFISLRGPSIFTDFQIEAKKKYLWLQDIMMPSQYTPDLIDQLDKIIVLSQYHRRTALNVPDGKFYFTTNGINLRLIEEIEKEGIKRVKNKSVYISSADRGLEPLVQMWPEVKKAVPDADLYWAYGWNSWNVFRKDGQAEKFKKKLIKDMKKAGIYELGRISKRDLYRLLFSASYHTYPLIGLAETSCISMMETQALGLFPISTGITALEETQQYGIKVPLKEYKTTLIKAMQENVGDNDEERQKMMKWARETYNWETVAQKWIDDGLFNV